MLQERAQEAFAGRQDMDWSHLSDKELEEKLVQRGVIHRKRETADVDNGHQTSPTFDKMNNCTDAMIALARRCVGNSFVSRIGRRKFERIGSNRKLSAGPGGKCSLLAAFRQRPSGRRRYLIGSLTYDSGEI